MQTALPQCIRILVSITFSPHRVQTTEDRILACPGSCIRTGVTDIMLSRGASSIHSSLASRSSPGMSGMPLPWNTTLTPLPVRLE